MFSHNGRSQKLDRGLEETFGMEMPVLSKQRRGTNDNRTPIHAKPKFNMYTGSDMLDVVGEDKIFASSANTSFPVAQSDVQVFGTSDDVCATPNFPRTGVELW